VDVARTLDGLEGVEVPHVLGAGNARVKGGAAGRDHQMLHATENGPVGCASVVSK
jgi:hypothetical protein